MPDDVKTAIEENAKGPAEVESDGARVKQHRLKEQIEADRHLSSRAGASNKTLGLRFRKLVPPGAD